MGNYVMVEMRTCLWVILILVKLATCINLVGKDINVKGIGGITFPCGKTTKLGYGVSIQWYAQYDWGFFFRI
jgi:hypothetical protein